MLIPKLQSTLIALLGIALLASACGDDGDQVSEPEPAAVAEPEPADDTTEPITAAPELLINCETSIDDDIPAFYATYFRCSDISLDGDMVVITGENLPPHLSYYYGEDHEQYEEFDYSRGDEYRPNPNEIAGETFTIRIPLDPTVTGTIIDGRTVNLVPGDSTDYPMGPAGVALDGAAYFNPLAAPGDDIEDEKYTFDSIDGHPQQQGAYHYHAASPGPLRILMELEMVTTDVPGEAEIELYGVMCDGTVLMGLVELDGSGVADDLDIQSGHVHDIVDGAGTTLLADRYHIHMSAEIGADPRGLSPEVQYYDTCLM